jgi:hypothetical protein
MPRLKAEQCSAIVKDAFLPIHPSCCKGKQKGFRKSGLFLNRCSPVVLFNDEENYLICYNMRLMFDRKQVTECISCVPKPVPLPPELVLPVAETREDRRCCRAKIIATQEGLKKRIVE